MKLSRTLLLFTILVLIASCSTSENETNLSEISETKKSEEVVDQNPIELPSNFYSRFEGKIGDYPITMDFIKMDSIITGSYYYNKNESPLSISGKYASGLKYEFSELAPSGNITGSFSGEFIGESKFKGIWTNPSKSKSLNFELNSVPTQLSSIELSHINKKKCNDREGTETCSLIDLWDLRFNCKDAEISRKIKAAIEYEICGTFGERKKSVRGLFDMLAETDDEFGFTLEIACAINSIYKNVLSVEINSYSYSYGAAHPNSWSSIVNLDLNTGEVIKLEDVVLPSGVETFLRTAEQIFKEKHGGPDEGWDYEPGNFTLAKNYAFQSKGIHFNYNPYEIGSYAQGMPSIFIPYENVQGLINPIWN